MQNKNYSVSTGTRVRVSCLCLSKTNHVPPARRNENLIRFLESFILLPVITLSMPLGSFLGVANTNVVTSPQIVLSQEQNMEASSLLAFNQAMEEKAQVLKYQAEAIDAYFKKRHMPLLGMGMKFALEAQKNDLDWRLLPAIAVRESTGGKHDCVKVENNPFGWGSCKISFKSNEEAIETLARNLGGNNPNTEHHYSGKTTKEILQKYNPPSIIPHYATQVMAIMNAIGEESVIPDVAKSFFDPSAQIM